MTDVTNNSHDDSQDHAPSALGSTSGAGESGLPGETMSFASRETESDAPVGSGDQANARREAESRLRATLETVRTKADDFRTQTRDWTQVRGKQARGVIDERPVTAIAAAFGVGIVLGLALSR